eukprot:COSAG02_NODE_2625_length_8397_cov_2.746806_1_plen_253_part_00
MGVAKDSAVVQLRHDIRDGRLAVPADSTVSSQRAAFAFDLDPDRLILLGAERDLHGQRSLLAGPVRSDPDASIAMDKALFEKTLFYSELSKKDIEAINRRNLLPATTFCDAPELDAQHVAMFGRGREDAQFKAFESLRVKQQALLKPVQCHFRALAAGSEALLGLQDVLIRLDAGEACDERMRADLHKCASFQKELIAAESDAILLAASELSELEIQKDEATVRGWSGDAGYKRERRSGKPRRVFRYRGSTG